MRFSEALEALNVAKRMTRVGWTRSNMFVFKVAGRTFTASREPLKAILGEGTMVTYHPHLDIKLQDGSVSVWNPAQDDIFADDWYEYGTH